MAYFINRTLRKSKPVEKVESRPIEKANPMPNFTVLVKNTFMTNQMLLISNMTIIF